MRTKIFASLTIIALFSMLVFISGCSKTPAPARVNGSTVSIYLFYGEGCPHCEAERPFLEDMKKIYNLDVKEYEVWYNLENKALFAQMARAYNVAPDGVPMTFIGENYFVGFSDSIKTQIESKINFCTQFNCSNPGEKLR
jgi:thiol-disulfide isomerase/thioredoxin